MDEEHHRAAPSPTHKNICSYWAVNGLCLKARRQGGLSFAQNCCQDERRDSKKTSNHRYLPIAKDFGAEPTELPLPARIVDHKVSHANRRWWAGRESNPDLQLRTLPCCSITLPTHL